MIMCTVQKRAIFLSPCVHTMAKICCNVHEIPLFKMIIADNPDGYEIQNDYKSTTQPF